MRHDVESALERLEPGESAGAFVVWYRFDPGLPVFAGHFPGNPMLPGVMQLELVRHAVERFVLGPRGIARVVKARYRAPVLPGQSVRVEVSMRAQPDGEQVKAVLSVKGAVVSSVTLLLRPRGADAETRGADGAG